MKKVASVERDRGLTFLAWCEDGKSWYQVYGNLANGNRHTDKWDVEIWYERRPDRFRSHSQAHSRTIKSGSPTHRKVCELALEYLGWEKQGNGGYVLPKSDID